MTSDRRPLVLIALASLAFCILAACAAKALGEESGASRAAAELAADDSAPDDHVAPDGASPDVASGIERWWQTGALAAPLAAAVFGLLVIVERVGATRWRWAAWLRTGSVRAWVSLA